MLEVKKNTRCQPSQRPQSFPYVCSTEKSLGKEVLRKLGPQCRVEGVSNLKVNPDKILSFEIITLLRINLTYL